MAKKAVELTKGEAQVVEGEFINVKQSTVRSVEGGHIELQQVGALTIDAEKVDVSQGATALLRGGELSLNQSVSIMSVADDIALNFSCSPISITRNNAHIEKSAVGVMLSKDIKTENSTSLVTIARNVEGNITTMMDWRSALAFGAALGGVLGLVKLFKRR